MSVPGTGVCNVDKLISCADCAGTPNGEAALDCAGVCVPGATLASWNGDGFCDAVESYGVGFGVDLLCEEYNFDGGDCDCRSRLCR